MNIDQYGEILKAHQTEHIGEVLEELIEERVEAFPDPDAPLETCVPPQTERDKLYEVQFVTDNWKCGTTEGELLYLCPVHYAEFNAKRRNFPETEIQIPRDEAL